MEAKSAPVMWFMQNFVSVLGFSRQHHCISSSKIKSLYVSHKIIAQACFVFRKKFFFVLLPLIHAIGVKIDPCAFHWNFVL